MNSSNLKQGLINDSEDDLSSLVIAKKDQKTARESAGFFGKMFITWVHPSLKLSQAQPLEIETIQPLSSQEKSKYLYEKFVYNLSKMERTENTVSKALYLTFKKQLVLILFWSFLQVVTSVAIPMMIKVIIDYVSDQERDYFQASLLVFYMTVIKAINMISTAQAKLEVRFFGFDAQSVLSVELLSKSLRTSFLSNPNFSAGEVINLMQVDAGKLQLVAFYLGVVLLVPMQLLVTIYLMFYYIGVSFLGGVLLLIVTAVWNGMIGRVFVKYQKDLLQAKDKRTSFANQMFSLIKFIKINAYEEYFKEKLFKLREVEAAAIRKRYLGTAFYIFSVWLSPLLIQTGTFYMEILLGLQITAGSTFAIIGLFQMLQYPLLQLPIAINEIMATNVSIKRIQKFLFTQELQLQCITSDHSEKIAVQIKDGNFYWSDNISLLEEQKKEESNKKNQLVYEEQETKLKQVLYNLDITVNKGSMIAIIGDVGSGKTSIIQAIIGEMLFNKEQIPRITVAGSLAYVGQKYWIQNLTVKDNILFGLSYNEQKYQDALKYSCLKQDLKILIKGDQTMIGEKGINLSGGQKARISLARAIYSDADILLLDDPISAVDAHVGNFIMNDCLNQQNDQIIQEVLQLCCLQNVLQRGLDTQISEGGDNLSAGEKQLICIARAILKKSKVVLIDEATANIDIETEHKIQETILNAFQNCTVITIAHRINTILHCDKIIVVDQGEIKEYGNTKALLAKKDSIFYGIYQEVLKNSSK